MWVFPSNKSIQREKVIIKLNKLVIVKSVFPDINSESE